MAHLEEDGAEIDFIEGRLAPDSRSCLAHRPIIVTDINSPLGHIIERLREDIDVDSDAAIDKDAVLLWTEDVKKVITGADLLGRLLSEI